MTALAWSPLKCSPRHVQVAWKQLKTNLNTAITLITLVLEWRRDEQQTSPRIAFLAEQLALGNCDNSIGLLGNKVGMMSLEQLRKISAHLPHFFYYGTIGLRGVRLWVEAPETGHLYSSGLPTSWYTICPEHVQYPQNHLHQAYGCVKAMLSCKPCVTANTIKSTRVDPTKRDTVNANWCMHKHTGCSWAKLNL